jgi:ubiquinone/menaquinone biosynthesis C-methylase UbiE
MNLRKNRSPFARDSICPSDGRSIAELQAEARRALELGQYVQAEVICANILELAPADKIGLTFLGKIYQASGRHRRAVKIFAKAIDADGLDAVSHFNIATSYQVLDRRPAAITHFKKAIALGLGGKHVEELIIRNPSVYECSERIRASLESPTQGQAVISVNDISTIANDLFIVSALATTPLGGLALENLFTQMRSALLALALAERTKTSPIEERVMAIFSALAQQFFINEYVFAQSDDETLHANQLREYLEQRLAVGNDVSSLMLAAVAAYFPLHKLAKTTSLLEMKWPDHTCDLLQQQLREPEEEAQDRLSILTLTSIEDTTSIEVMQQYDDNPYPRWLTSETHEIFDNDRRNTCPNQKILIAGCGTGRHAIAIAKTYSQARILAIDISRASLAYARRKTREAGLDNIEYAQADILKLEGIGQTFDRIEACGVLHHLADPMAGLRVLLSLLAPSGVMRLGLYSATARYSIAEARTIIAERGYRPIAGDIRLLRQSVIRERNDARWRKLIATAEDFYSMSGCHDLFFNVMEHRFAIPEIAEVLDENGLVFHGFEVDANTVGKFRRQYPEDRTLLNLDHWNAFEALNPDTFSHMYIFSVSKVPASARRDQ